MTRNEIVCSCALARIFMSTPAHVRRLIEIAGSARGVFCLAPDHVRAVLARAPVAAAAFASFRDWDAVERDLDACARLGIGAIAYTDPAYPPLVRMIHDPPPVIFIRGDVSLVRDVPCIAVVGARKATTPARENAFALARDLAARGIAVVSGMAYGIDSAAHEGALEALGGRTVAVWGCGPDVVYPSAKRNLARAIAKRGAIVTEFPPGTRPERHRFPQRNRLISALSAGVVVVEAAAKSGSLITASFALEHGREVLVLPSMPGLIACGGNRLLADDGAATVETAQDVVDAVFAGDRVPVWGKKAGHSKKTSDRQTRRARGGVAGEAHERNDDDPVLAVLNDDASVYLDDIIARSRQSAAAVSARLVELAIAGIVEELPGKRFRRATR